MLTTIFIVTSFMQIAHYSRHWLRLTRAIMEETREARLKDHLNWNNSTRRNPGLRAGRMAGGPVRRAA